MVGGWEGGTQSYSHWTQNGSLTDIEYKISNELYSDYVSVSPPLHPVRSEREWFSRM